MERFFSFYCNVIVYLKNISVRGVTLDLLTGYLLVAHCPHYLNFHVYNAFCFILTHIASVGSVFLSYCFTKSFSDPTNSRCYGQ